MPNEVWKPAAISVQSFAVPICTGVSWLVVELFPTCPELLSPQAQSVWSLLIASVCPIPAATLSHVAEEIRLGIDTGVVVVVPSPSWPFVF